VALAVAVAVIRVVMMVVVVVVRRRQRWGFMDMDRLLDVLFRAPV
jgi:heme exporter protein D